MAKHIEISVSGGNRADINPTLAIVDELVRIALHSGEARTATINASDITGTLTVSTVAEQG